MSWLSASHNSYIRSFVSHPQLFRPWIPTSARHRRRTPTIHRGSAQRTIAVRPTGRLQVTRQRSGTGRPSFTEDGRVRRPCPNQRIVASEAEEGDNAPRLTLHACIGKRIPINRNFAACQGKAAVQNNSSKTSALPILSCGEFASDFRDSQGYTAFCTVQLNGKVILDRRL